jgi:alpha-maltose-1-phosphate synthase
MKIAHLLRKYNPDEWGGTETAVKRLVEGLRTHAAEPVVFCPRLARPTVGDPFLQAGITVKRFRSHLPVWRISEAQRNEAIAVGGNLLSFELVGQLLREKALSVIHTHTLNRLGGTALTVARLRRLPLVVSIHGGLFDLPKEVGAQLVRPLRGGFEWGKVFGFCLRSKKVVESADAVVTCNAREAELISERYPRQRVIVQSHSVNAGRYREDAGAAVDRHFPELRDQPFLLVLGRLDPVKNQTWLLEQAPVLLRRHPDLRLVFAGACTNAAYGELMQATIRTLGLANRVTLTGGLPPEDPRLIGLLQRAKAVVVPSQSETFGLVIIEAWAAGTPVISSRTSGALELTRQGENGWLFDLADPAVFHAAVATVLEQPAVAAAAVERGRKEVLTRFDSAVLAGRIRDLYGELIARKQSRCTT